MCSTMSWVGSLVDSDCVFWLGLIEIVEEGGGHQKVPLFCGNFFICLIRKNNWTDWKLKFSPPPNLNLAKSKNTVKVNQRSNPRHGRAHKLISFIVFLLVLMKLYTKETSWPFLNKKLFECIAKLRILIYDFVNTGIPFHQH